MLALQVEVLQLTRTASLMQKEKHIMCVTSAPAIMEGTRAFAYATLDTRDPRTLHVCGYQNVATNLSMQPNCMLLHFPGNHLVMTQGPELTTHLMKDMTRGLPELEPRPHFRSEGTRSAKTLGSATVETYGDYDVVLAEDASDILDALELVNPSRRPVRTPELDAMVAWYKAAFPGYSFVLACFDGNVNPKHPIVVEYIPHNDDLLFIPGLDAHDGGLPRIGRYMERSFVCAYGAEDTKQQLTVNYSDGDIGSEYWAPSNVTGFNDNRLNGGNFDYVIPLEAVREGVFGPDLFAELVT